MFPGADIEGLIYGGLMYGGLNDGGPTRQIGQWTFVPLY